MAEATRTRSRRAVLVPAALGLALVGLFFYLRTSQAPGGEVAGGMTAGELDRTYGQLCGVRELAASEVDAARDLFFGQVHSPLHVIAAAAGEQDRRAAARMLEAKNDVESAFNTGASAPDVAGRLDRLLTTTAEALRSVGVSPSTCEI